MESLIGFAATLGSVGIAVALWSINRQMDLERQLAALQTKCEVAVKAAIYARQAQDRDIREAVDIAKAAMDEARDIRRLCEMEPGTYTEHVDPVTKRRTYMRADEADSERQMFLNNQGDALDFLEDKLDQVMGR